MSETREVHDPDMWQALQDENTRLLAAIASLREENANLGEENCEAQAESASLRERVRVLEEALEHIRKTTFDDGMGHYAAQAIAALNDQSVRET